MSIAIASNIEKNPCNDKYCNGHLVMKVVRAEDLNNDKLFENEGGIYDFQSFIIIILYIKILKNIFYKLYISL